jgi:hypothetical protein
MDDIILSTYLFRELTQCLDNAKCLQESVCFSKSLGRLVFVCFLEKFEDSLYVLKLTEACPASVAASDV